MFGGDRYANDQKLCRGLCEIFIQWKGIFCPCCGYKLKSKPKKKLTNPRCSFCNAMYSHRGITKWFKLDGKRECWDCHYHRVKITCVDCSKKDKLKSRNFSFSGGRWFCKLCYNKMLGKVYYSKYYENKIRTALLHLFKVDKVELIIG